MTSSLHHKKVVVIGSGWSGLSAACYLVNDGYSVTIYESAKQIGGRARSIKLDSHSFPEVDNGQHILIGAYHETFNLLRLISNNIEQHLKRHKLKLTMLKPDGDSLLLNAYNLPSPFHLFFGVLFCTGLSLTQKYRAMYFSYCLSKDSILNDADISVSELLLRYSQPLKLIKALWEPLCLATLNTPISHASARVFITVLKKSLLGNKMDSDFLFTTSNLSDLLPIPAKNYLEKAGSNIELSSRVSKLIINKNAIEAIIVNDKLIPTKNLIIALPPYACVKLLSEHIELQNTIKPLYQIDYQPICTIYYQYPKNVTMDQTMIGSWGTTLQWLFDRKMANQEGLMAAIISANGQHMQLDNDSLIKKVQSEIAQLFPEWPAPINAKVVREKRATFSCVVNISNIRPNNETPVNGLWLCGDYTNTNLPATIEGAIISGKIAATKLNQFDIK